jgi:serine/threonine protein kinase
VHRDIKPSNVLVLENDDGSCSLLLADHGLACAVGTCSTGGDLGWQHADMAAPRFDDNGCIVGDVEDCRLAVGRATNQLFDLWAAFRTVYCMARGSLPPQVDRSQVVALAQAFEVHLLAEAASATAQLAHDSLESVCSISSSSVPANNLQLFAAHRRAAEAAEAAASYADDAATAAAKVSTRLRSEHEAASSYAELASAAAHAARQHAAASQQCVVVLLRAKAAQLAAGNTTTPVLSIPSEFMSAEAAADVDSVARRFFRRSLDDYDERCREFDWQLELLEDTSLVPDLQDLLLRTLGSVREDRLMPVQALRHPYLADSVASFRAGLPLVAARLKAATRRARKATRRVQRMLDNMKAYEDFNVLLAVSDSDSSSGGSSTSNASSDISSVCSSVADEDAGEGVQPSPVDGPTVAVLEAAPEPAAANVAQGLSSSDGSITSSVRWVHICGHSSSSGGDAKDAAATVQPSPVNGPIVALLEAVSEPAAAAAPQALHSSSGSITAATSSSLPMLLTGDHGSSGGGCCFQKGDAGGAAAAVQPLLPIAVLADVPEPAPATVALGLGSISSGLPAATSSSN